YIETSFTKRQELRTTADQLRRLSRFFESLTRDDQPTECDIDTDRLVAMFGCGHEEAAGSSAEIKNARIWFCQLCFDSRMRVEEIASTFHRRQCVDCESPGHLGWLIRSKRPIVFD